VFEDLVSLIRTKYLIQEKVEIYKVAGIVSGNRVPVDSSRKSIDLYGIMVTKPESKEVRSVALKNKSRFGSYRGSQIQT
jgi:hypothetical protein